VTATTETVPIMGDGPRSSGDTGARAFRRLWLAQGLSVAGDGMRGRVQSAYLTFSVGGHAVGGFLGGALGGPTGPLGSAFGLMSLLCLLAGPFLWRADWPRD